MYAQENEMLRDVQLWKPIPITYTDCPGNNLQAD